MSKRFQRTSISLLLAATLVAGMLMPPVIQHAHQGGADPAHRHDGLVGDRLDDEDHSIRGHQHCGRTSGVAAITAHNAHVHFQWLGFQVTLPDRDTNSPIDGGEEHRTSEWVFVRAAQDLDAAFQTLRDTGGSPMVDLHQSPLGDTAQVSTFVSFSIGQVTVLPLCDRARRERSGVLLV